MLKKSHRWRRSGDGTTKETPQHHMSADPMPMSAHFARVQALDDRPTEPGLDEDRQQGRYYYAPAWEPSEHFLKKQAKEAAAKLAREQAAASPRGL